MKLLIEAQTPLGFWMLTDDKQADIRTIVEIYQKQEMLYAKVIELDPKALIKTCRMCSGIKKNKSLLGMDIIWDLKKNQNEWTSGFILDPESGKEYDCKLWMVGNDEIMVRGFYKLPIFGKTKIWTRIK